MEAGWLKAVSCDAEGAVKHAGQVLRASSTQTAHQQPPGPCRQILNSPPASGAFLSLQVHWGVLALIQPEAAPKPGPASGFGGRGRRKFQAKEMDEQRNGVA